MRTAPELVATKSHAMPDGRTRAGASTLRTCGGVAAASALAHRKTVCARRCTCRGVWGGGACVNVRSRRPWRGVLYAPVRTEGPWLHTAAQRGMDQLDVSGCRCSRRRHAPAGSLVTNCWRLLRWSSCAGRMQLWGCGGQGWTWPMGHGYVLCNPYAKCSSTSLPACRSRAQTCAADEPGRQPTRSPLIHSPTVHGAPPSPAPQPRDTKDCQYETDFWFYTCPSCDNVLGS